MKELALRLSGNPITVLYGCFAQPGGLKLQDLVSRAAERFGEGEWVVFVKGCCRLPPREVIVSATLYTLRNRYYGRMITRAFAYEFLVFSLADRNIRKIKEFFEGSPEDTVGYVGATTGDGSVFKKKLLDFAAEYRLEERELDENCWVAEYSSYLGVPPDPERLLGILRAKAALLALSL